MIEILKEPLTLLITTLITGFGGWFFGRKKLKAETEASQIENAEKLLDFYKNLADDLGKRLENAIREFNDAKKIITELEEKVENLTNELKKYKQLNGKVN
ncbi:cell wall anchor protein [Chryseobacterium salviniae]|uniref:Cell wall anchor protein n=1 Tax=Chryseobacterium salviniae TaxID=3101750 RepID=A0ABU6HS87_9FLAO|nr:cell wall anchor protein [Chryseobacterium sp. T9W2-O]MEC3875929.1 cell wall anchor protein [Chryseobacterium sp. T9W2-O]